MKTRLHLLALLALFATGIAVAAPFGVVKDGKPLCAIQLPKDANHVVKLAADELQKWIAEITGAKLELTDDADGRRIVLEVSDQIPELKNNDGYAIRSDENAFRIVASCPKGILNGVYKVLYKNTDIIWVRPDVDFGTVFSKTQDLDFNGDDLIDVPVFKQRGWQMDCRSKDEILANCFWLARQGVNWMTRHVDKFGCIKEWGGGHNLCGRFLPEKLYYKDHADFYPLINGKRVKHSELQGGCQLCFTNPEMTKEFIKRLDMFVKKNIQHTVIRVMLEDNYNLCCCDTCLEPITLPDGSILDGRNLKPRSYEWKVWRSTQFFLWYTQLAEFMKQNYPDKRLLSFAYFFTEYAPKITIPDNVDISFCPIYRDSKHLVDAPKNKIVMDTLNEWLQKTKNVTWREYYGINTEFPRPIDRVAFHDYALLSQKGMTKTYSELIADTVDKRWTSSCGKYVWDVGAPFLWSLAQAPWNPNQDVEEVRRDFYRRVFGKAAAPEVEALYNTFEKGWYTSPRKSVWNDKYSTLWRECYAKPGIAPTVRKHLDRALELVSTENGKTMLRRLKNYLDNHSLPKPAPAVVIPKAKAPVPMEASDASPAWQNALVFDKIVDHANAPSKYPTVFKFIHDGTHIYAYMHAERKGIDAMLDSSANYCQTEVFNLFFQLDDETYPDYFHIMVDPLKRTYSSARDNRQIKDFKYQCAVTCNKDNWSCLIVVPIARLPKKHAIAAFRRYNNHDKPAIWPLTGPGIPKTILHEVESFAPFTLGE